MKKKAEIIENHRHFLDPANGGKKSQIGEILSVLA
jgi:hypothetical protein